MIPTGREQEPMNRPFPRFLIESQTTDITNFACVDHYDVTIKALETLQSTAYWYNSWRYNEKQRQSV